MILSFLFFAFLAYLAYKLVIDFILPIYRTTRQVKKTFRDMQQKMNPQNGSSHNNPGKPNSNPAADKKSTVGDYIDFEEVKD